MQHETEASGNWILLHQGNVGVHHVLHQVRELHLGLPAQFGLGLGGVPQELLYLRRSVELGIDFDPNNSRADFSSLFIVAFSFPFNLLSNVSEGRLYKLPD